MDRRKARKDIGNYLELVSDDLITRINTARAAIFDDELHSPLDREERREVDRITQEAFDAAFRIATYGRLLNGKAFWPFTGE